jgi:hypothetical protein
MDKGCLLKQGVVLEKQVIKHGRFTDGLKEDVSTVYGMLLFGLVLLFLGLIAGKESTYFCALIITIAGAMVLFLWTLSGVTAISKEEVYVVKKRR